MDFFLHVSLAKYAVIAVVKVRLDDFPRSVAARRILPARVSTIVKELTGDTRSVLAEARISRRDAFKQFPRAANCSVWPRGNARGRINCGHLIEPGDSCE